MHLQIRPTVIWHNIKQPMWTTLIPYNSCSTAWTLQVSPLLLKVSTSCPWCPKHLIWMYHVAAGLYSEPDLCLTLTLCLLTLPTLTKATKHLLSVWNQTHTAEKALGGLTETLSKWWVAEWVSVGWQLHWWLEDWKVEPVGRSLVPGKSLPCCLGQGAASFSKWMIFNKC